MAPWESTLSKINHCYQKQLSITVLSVLPKMTVVLAGFLLVTDLASAKFKPKEYCLVHRWSGGLTGIGETKTEVRRALALCWMWGAGKQRVFEVWPVSDGNLRAQMSIVLDTRARCCTVLNVTCYLSCFIACTLSTPLISVMGLYRTELFSLCPALSPKGAVGPLFVWPSPFQLTCLALTSYSAFAKGEKCTPGWLEKISFQ